jgi:hypothetical protein
MAITRCGTGMNDPIVKLLLMASLIGSSLLISLLARGEAVEAAISKVTIVVDGMMKSKSGAT